MKMLNLLKLVCLFSSSFCMPQQSLSRKQPQQSTQKSQQSSPQSKQSPPQPQQFPPKLHHSPPQAQHSPSQPQHSPSQPQQSPSQPQQSPPKPQQSPSQPQQSPPKPQQSPSQPQQSPPKPQQSPSQPQQSPPKPQQSPSQPQQSLPHTQSRCASFRSSGYRCVPYFQCDERGIINTDGSNILGPRSNFAPNDSEMEHEVEHQVAMAGACATLLEVCCRLNDDVDDTVTAAPVPSRVKCGARNPPNASNLINSGHPSTGFGEWPHVCAVLHHDLLDDIMLNTFLAAGSLIHPKVILTAAHKVDGADEEKLFARCGEWDTVNQDEPLEHQERDVDSIIIHPKFNKRNLQWNFALLIMKEEFLLAKHISPVCLPSPSQAYQQKNCVANGWGKDKFGSSGQFQNKLKQVDLPLVDDGKCQDQLRKTRLGRFFQLDDSFICAGGEKGIDTCKGDGGGPLACRHGEAGPWVQEGIVSWGIGCGDDIPAVYARVSKAVCWIDKVLGCHLGSQPGESFMGVQDDCSEDYFIDDYQCPNST